MTGILFKNCLGLTAVLALTAACGDDDSSTPPAYPISIPFAGMVGDQAAACETSYTVGSAGTAVSLLDFRFYVSDLKVMNAAGEEFLITLDRNDYQTDGVALLDFQNKADQCAGDPKDIRAQVEGSVGLAVADITGISFQLGLPAELNHLDQSLAKSPLNIGSMYWSWKGGYKFARIDVKPADGITAPDGAASSANVFHFHLGSGGCEGDFASGGEVTCAQSNRPLIKLTEFNPAEEKIVLDYAALVADITVNVDSGGAPGCMSGKDDPECGSVMAKLGLDVSSGDVSSTSAQTAFRVVAQ